MIRIYTDGAGDFFSEEAEQGKLGIIPISVRFEEDDVAQKDLDDYNRFFKKLGESDNLPSTSAPTPGEIRKAFQSIEGTEDDLIYLTMSSGLSSAYRLACKLADAMQNPHIHVVDSRQVSLSQHMLVLYALSLRDRGLSVEAIIEEILAIRDRPLIIGVLDSLMHLKKGGRIPAAAAGIGEKLKIKPIICLENTVVNLLGIPRGRKMGVKKLVQRLLKDGMDPRFPLYVIYTLNRERAEKLKEAIESSRAFQALQEEVKESEMDVPPHIEIRSIGPVMGTHTGPQAIGLCFMRKK